MLSLFSLVLFFNNLVDGCSRFYDSGHTFAPCLAGDVLLAPTKIYSRLLLPLLRSGAVKAYAHITGGGLLENIPRVLPSDLAVDLGGSNCT